jgi:hypothetical protein
MLTRTSGVLAISAMLAVGACCASAKPGCINAAENASTFKDFANATLPFLQTGSGVSPTF